MSSSSRNRSSGGLIGYISSVFLQPRAFFYKLPHTRHWLFVAMLILAVYGFSAANQQVTTQTFIESVDNQTVERTIPNTDDGQLVDPTASDLPDGSESIQNISNTIDNPALVQADANPTPLTLTTETVTTTEDSPTLVTSLMAATDLLVLWTGQALLLSIVMMAKGYMPNISRSFQIAVWASLPLALMLILRQLFFSAGGEGGSVGLIVLLESWEGYSDLSIPIQQFLAIFASNLTIFWVWNMALLYFGARYALGGNRVLIAMVLSLWIILSTGVMTFSTDPIVAIEPLPQTETEVVEDDDSDNSQTITTQTGFNNFGGDAGGFPGGGNFEPPTGGGRGGN